MSNNNEPTRFEKLSLVYKEAHEQRRRWEGYIWQYSAILMLIAGAIALQDPIFELIFKSELDKSLPIYEKILFTLLTLIYASIASNIYRAVILMKSLEREIAEIHSELEVGYSIVSVEFNRKLHWIKRISSTKIAVFSHAIILATLIITTIVLWLK